MCRRKKNNILIQIYVEIVVQSLTKDLYKQGHRLGRHDDPVSPSIFKGAKFAITDPHQTQFFPKKNQNRPNTDPKQPIDLEHTIYASLGRGGWGLGVGG